MSSRYAFSVYDIDGLKRDLEKTNFTVYKGGVEDTSIEVINNNDGTYYFTVLETNKYSVKINGITQDEMTNIFIVTDDIVTQALVDNTTIEFAGGALSVKSGVFSSVGHTHDYASSDHTHGTEGPDWDFYFTAGGLLALKDRATMSDAILSEDESLAQNMANLSAEIILLQESISESGALHYRQVAGYYNYANGAPGDTHADNTISDTWTETSETYIQKMAVGFLKRPGDTEVVVNITVQTDTPATGYIRIKTGAEAQLVETLEFTDTDSMAYQIVVDISGESNQSHEIQLFMRSSDVLKTAECQLVSIEIR